MESRGSSIRSAARATFSAYRTIPVRWRLAGGSAALTFVILAAFAALVGVLTTTQVRGSFNSDTFATPNRLARELNLRWLPTGELGCNTNVTLSDYVAAEHAQVRIFSDDGYPLCTQTQVLKRKAAKTHGANRAQDGVRPQLTPDFPAPASPGVSQELGYRVVVPHRLRVTGGGPERYVW